MLYFKMCVCVCGGYQRQLETSVEVFSLNRWSWWGQELQCLLAFTRSYYLANVIQPQTRYYCLLKITRKTVTVFYPKFIPSCKLWLVFFLSALLCNSSGPQQWQQMTLRGPWPSFRHHLHSHTGNLKLDVPVYWSKAAAATLTSTHRAPQTLH